MEEFNLFKEITVWREVNKNTFYRYRGFQNLKTNTYCFFYCDHIHSQDYDNPATQKHQEFAFRQNLFAGGLNHIGKSEMFDSIEAAILDFDGE